MAKPLSTAGPSSHPDPWQVLTRFTAARIGLGRAGGSQPTKPSLAFQLAHAQARDAVQRNLDVDALAEQLGAAGLDSLRLHSAAPDRRTFIARPDLGRILNEESKRSLETRGPPASAYDCALVVADGLSALAIEHHAVALLQELARRLAAEGWRVSPVCLVRQGRVAIGDEIGALLPARMTAMLIGERPGLSSPDSLGIYFTYDPVPGRSNAERNCISNVRPPEGLSYALAAHRLYHLMVEARRRKLSGVALKEAAPALPGEAE
ncbi:MAG: ethanolamine ammonia-lyase subunit EutC [Burkholderiales bacterium]